MTKTQFLKSIPLLLSLGLFITLMSCNSSSNSSFDDSLVSPAMIGPSGGSIRSQDGLMKLTIPAGALTTQTEISLTEVDPGIDLGGRAFRVYEALPDGLTFAVPVTLEAQAGDIYDQGTMPILISASGEAGVEIASNHEVERDFDTGETFVRGTFTHFSSFSVGGTTFTASIDGVPFTAPANSTFGPIVPSVTRSGFIPNISSSISDNTFRDSSAAPVSYSGENPIRLTAENGLPLLGGDPDDSVKASLTYNCGDPGLGTFVGRITMNGTIRSVYTTTVTETEFGLTPNLFLVEVERQVTRVFENPYSQTFIGRRVVNCAAEMPEETPEPTAEPTSEPTSEPTTEPTAEPTAEPTPDVTTTSLSASTDSLSFSHTVGETGCPQEIGTVTITNDGAVATEVVISTSTGALSTTEATFFLGAGESRNVTLIFTCSQRTSFTGTVTFSPNTGGSSATVTVSGSVG